MSMTSKLPIMYEERYEDRNACFMRVETQKAVGMVVPSEAPGLPYIAYYIQHAPPDAPSMLHI